MKKNDNDYEYNNQRWRNCRENRQRCDNRGTVIDLGGNRVRNDWFRRRVGLAYGNR